ncbi:MAG: DUF3944 domain-containing protein [Parabacteroides sp.]|nr:DUF3944 domain-containing protein [Parabacteroides sp.]
MRYDKDLQFLAECRNEDLKTLADYLMHDAKGEIRMAEQLMDTGCGLPAETRLEKRLLFSPVHMDGF